MSLSLIFALPTWQNWLMGFFIWVVAVGFLALISYLITSAKSEALRGNIPDQAFTYSYRPDFIPENAFLLDTHSHTIASDGWMTPEQNIKWHIANGFNAFVITDHNTSESNPPSMQLQEKYPDILIIPGYEWTNPRVHINILGVESFTKPSKRNPSDEEIRNIIKKGKEMGGIVQLDHYTWTQDRPEQRSGDFVHPSRKDLIEWGVDGFEINNEMRWYDPKTVHLLNRWKNDGVIDRDIYMATGTDVHNPLREWCTAWTEILLTPEERKDVSWAVVKRALKEGRTRIWVDHDYRKPPESLYDKNEGSTKKKNLFAPFYGIVHGLLYVPGGVKGIISYIAWFLLAYFPIRGIFELIFLI